MPYDELLATRVRSFFKRREVVFEEKRMMGGLCFLVGAKMCVGIEKNRLMARLDPAICDSALGGTGCEPMDFTGRPMRGFVFVNPAGISTDDALEHWLGLALEFNPRANVPKKKPARKPRTPVHARTGRSTRKV